MCGIVGANAERNVVAILIEGLKRLEYRGYDSAGLAVVSQQEIKRIRALGKVAALEHTCPTSLDGNLGIAHTRWATHGAPSERNAHPHQSQHIAVVHNGIIENYAELKAELMAKGYQFTSDTDTEVVVHLVFDAYQQLGEETNPLLTAVQNIVPRLKGAFALGIVSAKHPNQLVAVREGSPLVVGVGIGEHFIASDQLALLPVTHRFIYLEEQDVVDIYRDHIDIYHQGHVVTRPVVELDAIEHHHDKGPYKHFMLKEIYEQPDAITRTLTMGLDRQQLKSTFLAEASQLAQIEQINIIACGTSYNAGLVAKYWFEKILGIQTLVEIASEFRYRTPVIANNVLAVFISQSGETADTLAALRYIKQIVTHQYVQYLSVCNVATSTLVRETDLHVMTQAGAEIGVASTKAFTTQLCALWMLMLKLGQVKQLFTQDQMGAWIDAAWHIPSLLKQTLALDEQILTVSKLFVEKNHALFLGRGTQFAIAMEGALKLKEISYIHAESYAAGELKHGPLALVDKDMPVVFLAPLDDMFDKLKSNMEEVKARGGELFIFADASQRLAQEERQHVIHMPAVDEVFAPIIYSVGVQLLSYHVAVLRGTDVDQPRNLAKSVTVE